MWTVKAPGIMRPDAGGRGGGSVPLRRSERPSEDVA